MKSASTLLRSEALLAVLEGANAHPIARAEFQDDTGEWNDLDDVLSLSISKKSVDNRYNSFSLLPAVSDLSVSMDNKSQKYSPGADTIFDGILTRNRPIRVKLGYRTKVPVTTETAIDTFGTVMEAWHGKVVSGRIQPDISSPPGPPSITMIPGTTYGSVYGGALYGSTYLNFEGYVRQRVDIGKIRLNGGAGAGINNLKVDADRAGVVIFARWGVDVATLEAAAWTSIGAAAAGTNTFSFANISTKWVEFLWVFTSGSWNAGWVENARVVVQDYDEVFDQGVFLADDPSFSSNPGKYEASFSARDSLKKALETQISLPAYTSQDVMQIVRDACDRSDIPYDAASLADLGVVVSTPSDQPFTNASTKDVLEECLTYIVAKTGITYRLVMNDAGSMIRTQKPLSAVVADHVLSADYDLLSLSKKLSSNNLLQRATVMAKEAATNPQVLLATQAIGVAGDYTVSWTGAAVYKSVDVLYGASDLSATVEVLAVTNTSIQFRVAGSGVIDVTLKIYGNKFSSTTPSFGESIASVNHITSAQAQNYSTRQRRDGFTYKWLNRFIANDTEAKNAAERMTDEFGNKKYQLTVSVWGLPQAEVNDKMMVIEKYSSTASIFVLESISHQFSADKASFRTSLTFTDLGFTLGDFFYDRNGIFAGDLDILFDTGYIWDMDMSAVDTTTYTNGRVACA